MFIGRFADPAPDAEPVTHRRDRAERHAGLRHAPGPRVHAEEQDPSPISRGKLQISLCRVAGILDRVVYVCGRRRESEAAQRAGQLPIDGFEFVGEQTGILEQGVEAAGDHYPGPQRQNKFSQPRDRCAILAPAVRTAGLREKKCRSSAPSFR